MRKLPLGMQDFAGIREDGYLYVEFLVAGGNSLMGRRGGVHLLLTVLNGNGKNIRLSGSTSIRVIIQKG
jgi:hypothetical protein